MRRPLVLTAILAAALAGCGGGSGSSSGSTATTLTKHPSTVPKPAPTGTLPAATGTPTHSAGRAIVVTLHAPRRSPRAGRGWPVRITARTSAGKPVDGVVSYAFVLGGHVVARRPGGRMRHGTYRDRLTFPARAAGLPLTLRVVVRSGAVKGTVSRRVGVQR